MQEEEQGKNLSSLREVFSFPAFPISSANRLVRTFFDVLIAHLKRDRDSRECSFARRAAQLDFAAVGGGELLGAGRYRRAARGRHAGGGGMIRRELAREQKADAPGGASDHKHEITPKGEFHARGHWKLQVACGGV